MSGRGPSDGERIYRPRTEEQPLRPHERGTFMAEPSAPVRRGPVGMTEPTLRQPSVQSPLPGGPFARDPASLDPSSEGLGREDPSMDDILASIRRIIAEEEPHLSDAPEPAPPRHSELQGQRPESTAVPGEAPRAGREAAPGAERTADATAPARGSMSAPARPLPPGGEAAPVRTHTRVPPLPAATELPGRDASAGAPRSERPPLPPRTPLSGPPMPDSLRAALLDHMAGSTLHAPGSSELGPDFTTQLENALLEVGMADSTPSHDPAESSRPPVRPVAPVREVGKRKDLLSPEVEGAVASAFESLGAALLPAHGRTMEDLVKEILRPMLKSWLDDNLPRIVERLVRQEIERISRSSR